MEREDWLEALGARQSSGREWVLPRCPWCSKERHLYVNIRTGKWTCFRCDEKGRWLRLYAEIEGITESEAARQAMEAAFAGRATGSSAPAEPEEPELPADVDLPSDFIPVWDGKAWTWPTYLTDRGVKRTTGAAYKLGFAKAGRYARRIIFPVSCPGGRSFTARSILPADVEPLRYDSGPDCGRLLFGWDQAMAGKRSLLLLVEGPFDVLSCYQAGLPAVALLGKRLRDAQVEMLSDADVKRIILLLDDDARSDALAQVGSERLEAINGRLSVARLDEGDPGESTPAILRAAVDGAISAEEARLEWASSVLDGIT